MHGLTIASLLAAAGLAGCGFHVASGGTAGGDAGGDAGPDSSIDAPDASPDAQPDAAPDAPTPSPLRRVKLTFQNGTRNIGLDNFVALVVLDPARVDYAAIKAGGANLRFTDPDGTALPYQIDEWAAGGTSYVWVRVPLIDASSDADFIYLHYGDPALTDAQNPTAVWAGQSAVWHLSQDPGPGGLGDIKDATGAHDGTASTAMTSADLVPGIVGNGMHFVGAGGTGITATTMALGTYTWSMWIKGAAAPTTGSNNKEPINNGDLNFNFSWDHSMTAFTGAAAQKDAVGWRSVAPSPGLAGMTWYYLSGSYDGTNLCVYQNGGTGACTTAGAPLAPIGTFQIGLASSGAATFAGWIDEVRVTPGALSAKRLNAEYANQRAASGSPFVVFSAPEVEP